MKQNALSPEVKALTDSIFGFACGLNRLHATMLRQEPAALQPTTQAALDPEGAPTVRRVRTIDQLMQKAD